MTTLKEWLGDSRQRLMTHLVNRTCRQQPGALDRLATYVLSRVVGRPPKDPELEHPEAETPHMPR